MFTEERVGSRWLGGGTVDFVDDLDTDEQLSLEVYGTTARHEIDSTHDQQTLGDHRDGMQASHYDSWANMGGGLERAIEELSSSRVRGMSIKMIILLTDGQANVTADGETGNYSGGAAYALEQAQLASAFLRSVSVPGRIRA